MAKQELLFYRVGLNFFLTWIRQKCEIKFSKKVDKKIRQMVGVENSNLLWTNLVTFQKVCLYCKHSMPKISWSVAALGI